MINDNAETDSDLCTRHRGELPCIYIIFLKIEIYI